MSKNDHSYWTPQHDVEHQREKQTHGPDPALSYRNGLSPKMNEAEYLKCVNSVYWKELTPTTRRFIPFIYDNYDEFKKYLTAMGVKI